MEGAAEDGHDQDRHEGERRSSRDGRHEGVPPSWDRPGGPLPCPGGLPEQVDEVVGGLGVGQVGEGARQLALERVDGGHARRPSVTMSDPVAPSLPTVVRMTPSERWRRDLAVPNGMPRASATSGSGSPR